MLIGAGTPRRSNSDRSSLDHGLLIHPVPLDDLPIPVDIKPFPIFHRAEIHPRFSPGSHFYGLQSNFFRRMVKLLDFDFDELRGLDFTKGLVSTFRRLTACKVETIFISFDR